MQELKRAAPMASSEKKTLPPLGCRQKSSTLSLLSFVNVFCQTYFHTYSVFLVRGHQYGVARNMGQGLSVKLPRVHRVGGTRYIARAV